MTRPGEVRSGAEIMCEALVRQDVEVIFGIPGGAIMPFYDALYEFGDQLRHVLCRHEQGAGHAAEGYARASGRTGVCVATSGPGATNLVTPIADAWMDSTPIVVITGQVPGPMLGTDAFQEVDIAGVTLPITKQSYVVRSAAELPRVFAEAFYLARTGRPGPVLIDVTKDAQRERVVPNWDVAYHLPGYVDTRVTPLDRPAIRRAAELISAAERPLILAGQGIIHAGAQRELLAFAERTGMPVATTLHGLGAFPQAHPLSLGLVGMHGWAHVNRAIQRCDVLLNVGSRFDDRVTGKPGTFARQAKIVHVDIDGAELGKNVPIDVGIVGDALRVLRTLIDVTPPRDTRAWRHEIGRLRSEHAPKPHRSDRAAAGILSPNEVYASLRRAIGTRDDVRIVTDVGQHQMWAAQLLEWWRPRTHLTSGGAGTMGFAIPAALGAALAAPEETIWAIVGDGGFQMTNQELATIAQEGVTNLKIAIINNGYLGMVRQWQELFESRRYSATRLSGPSIARLADAYGVCGMTVTAPDQVAEAIDEAWQHPGCVVIDFQVEREANVFPIVPQGHEIGDMLVGPKPAALSVPRPAAC
jgi:acetolactate synthase-1/2/3 large subunit